MKNKTKILFICKKRNDAYGPSFGLINSCRFICNALHKHNIVADVISVTDNNDIDREVTRFNPTHVFIEALWVVPSKFNILMKLHPKVEWYVRIHSKVPFLAHEGMAIEWMREYSEISRRHHKLHLTSNSMETVKDFEKAYRIKIFYYPNIYCPTHYTEYSPTECSGNNIINIGCFGAVRPMKNQLIQALAAISFANKTGLWLRFHINGDRIEQKGNGVFKNLENAFKDSKHELVKHPWMNHEPFIHLIKRMDVGMQVSMSESFNIVAADFVWNNIPVIGSSEISWLSFLYKADPNSIDDMIKKLYLSVYGKQINLQRWNLCKLQNYNKKATKIWLNTI